MSQRTDTLKRQNCNWLKTPPYLGLFEPSKAAEIAIGEGIDKSGGSRIGLYLSVRARSSRMGWRRESNTHLTKLNLWRGD